MVKALSYLTSGSYLISRHVLAGSSPLTPYQTWQRTRLAAQQQQELAEDTMCLFVCRICLDMPPDDSICLEPCKHGFYKGCIKGHIDSKLDEQKFPIVCPVCVTGSVSGDGGGG